MKKVFIYRPQIRKTDIDVLGHVNNEVYLRWLIEAATGHSGFLGYTLDKFIEMGCAFVVRHHELDYQWPTFLDDQLRVETWTMPMEGSRALRKYEIYNEKTDRLILSGSTMWVFVNLETGRPTKIPDEIIQAFAQFPSQKAILQQK